MSSEDSKENLLSFDWSKFCEFFASLNESNDPSDVMNLKSEALANSDEFKRRVAAMTLKLRTKNENFIVDASKQLVPHQKLAKIIEYLEGTNFMQVLAEMKNKKLVNYSEQRMVLHIALRDQKNKLINDEKITNDVNDVLKRMGDFVNKIHSGEFKGYTGKKFKYFVNIGIGGSDLGPHMACNALQPYSLGHIECYFVSNVDANHLMQVFDRIDIEETLFGVCSKTFTTKETLMNAMAARRLVFEHFKSDDQQIVKKHFCALSANLEETSKFGIDSSRVFEFWDWVGGRYSLWSAIGLSIMMQIGYDRFLEFLEGAHAMDEHFFSANLSQNIPIVIGIIKLWNLNVLKLQTEAILPYDQNLELFCSFLQQLESESNGKTFSREGKRVPMSSSAVIFGQPGTNGQHAFYQMIHQGQLTIPSTFIFAREPANLDRFSATKKQIMMEQHRTLIANAIAQTEALMIGKDDNEVEKELQSKNVPMKSIQMLKFAKSFEGNRPTTSICIDSLTPHALGMLIALFEHQTYVTGILTGINSFDQFGVELGKKLALQVESELKTKKHSAHDASTAQAIDFAARI